VSADRAIRLSEIGAVLAERRPNVLTAVIVLLESMLAAVDAELRIERASTAPVTLTAEHVLEVARSRGVPAFGSGAPDRLILLASLGLDLTRPEVRAALLDLHRHGKIELVPVDTPDLARADLAHRDHRPELLDESAIVDGATTHHAVLL
jgi:hypothetical protein